MRQIFLKLYLAIVLYVCAENGSRYITNTSLRIIYCLYVLLKNITLNNEEECISSKASPHKNMSHFSLHDYQPINFLYLHKYVYIFCTFFSVFFSGIGFFPVLHSHHFNRFTFLVQYLVQFSCTVFATIHLNFNFCHFTSSACKFLIFTDLF